MEGSSSPAARSQFLFSFFSLPFHLSIALLTDESEGLHDYRWGMAYRASLVCGGHYISQGVACHFVSC